MAFYQLVLVCLFSLFFGFHAMAASFTDSLDSSKRYLAEGQYRFAADEAAKALAAASGPEQLARASGLLGQIQLIMKQYPAAEENLLKAMELVREGSLEKAGYANNLGSLHSAIENTDEAEKFFQLALQSTESGNALKASIQLNRLRNKPGLITAAGLKTLTQDIAGLSSREERLRNYLNLAGLIKEQNDNSLQEILQKNLEVAYAESAGISDTRLRLELTESLADSYEKRGMEQQALSLSETATAKQISTGLEDVLINLESRKGRLYSKMGNDTSALVAYGKAVENIQAIRMDIPVEYHDGHSSFRETLSPVYLGYANQLLKKASLQTGDEKQKSLILARSSVEQIKQTEMEDFLGGRCLIEGLRRSELDSLDGSAATIYPVLLADRLELLVSMGKTMHQVTVPVTDKQVRSTTYSLADKLRNMEPDYKPASEKLYQWLVAPIAKQLEAANIKTLVVIPDGVLRLVPFSSLYDGKQYLIEKYAVSVSPGISLMAGGKREGNSFNTLLAGLSKPGGVVEKLPFEIVTAILEPGERGAGHRALPGTRSLGGISLRAEEKSKRRQAEMRTAEHLLRTPGAVQKLQEQLSLPGVENEINNLQKSVKNTTILNADFTVDSFHQQAASQAYDMIHIASHGVFSSDAESSFLMAHDNVLKIDEIQSLLKGENPGKSIDLLTLSACETAEGDDRAPLGFTGMALKANARSAIGTLWPISDVAASQLMVSFYKNLGKNTGKAEALRQAQLELLGNKELNHPFYWSPFILVGNWM